MDEAFTAELTPRDYSPAFGRQNSPSHTNIATFISNSLDAEFDAAQYLYTDL